MAEVLVGAGFDVVNVGGGMRAWEAADLPIETDDGSPGTVMMTRVRARNMCHAWASSAGS